MARPPSPCSTRSLRAKIATYQLLADAARFSTTRADVREHPVEQRLRFLRDLLKVFDLARRFFHRLRVHALGRLLEQLRAQPGRNGNLRKLLQRDTQQPANAPVLRGFVDDARLASLAADLLLGQRDTLAEVLAYIRFEAHALRDPELAADRLLVAFERAERDPQGLACLAGSDALDRKRDHAPLLRRDPACSIDHRFVHRRQPFQSNAFCPNRTFNSA